MLYYKNNRFHICGLSYALPENIYLISDFERNLNSGFAYKSADQKILVTIDTDNYKGDYFNSKDFLENAFEIKEISPFGYSDIKGTMCIYASKYNEYCEVRLDLPRPVCGDNILIILIEVKKGNIAIEDAVKTASVIDLLQSLKKDMSASAFI